MLFVHFSERGALHQFGFKLIHVSMDELGPVILLESVSARDVDIDSSYDRDALFDEPMSHRARSAKKIDGRNPFHFVAVLLIIVVILFMTAVGRFLTSCSQIRTTRHPFFLSCPSTFPSRRLLAANFSSQYSRWVSGLRFLRHFVQPCQKHPSTNTAARDRGKAKSGRPGRLRRWRRQPVIPLSFNKITIAPSVDLLSRPLIRDITWERLARLKISVMTR